MTFFSRGLVRDRITSIYETDLDIFKTYLHVKNEISKSRVSKVRARNGTDKHTDSRDRTHYQPHLRVVDN